jgi:hypothetical protein
MGASIEGFVAVGCRSRIRVLTQKVEGRIIHHRDAEPIVWKEVVY